MTDETWLSPEAFERLQGELEERRTTRRVQLSAEIETARAHGDIRENAEYHASKDAQGMNEARIRELEQLLRDAKVGAPSTHGEVAPGRVVTVEVDGDDETYLLVSSREDRRDGYQVLTTASPLGQAIVGARPGDVVQAQAPAGSYDVKVKDVREPS